MKTTSAHIYIGQTHRDSLASVEDTPDIRENGLKLKIKKKLGTIKLIFCSHLMEITNGSSTLSLCVAFADLSPF